MAIATESDELQRTLARQYNQIQALVAAQLFTLDTLIQIAPRAGLSPAEISVLKGQYEALNTLRQKK